MKTMTCTQLGGACDKKFTASTFEEIASLSKNHGMEMFEIGDKAHLEAMEEMKKLMQNPEEMRAWQMQREEEFNALAEN